MIGKSNGFPKSKVPVPSIMILIFVGLIFRVLPILNFDGRLFKQFPTEDGYLMLTIARNISQGLGMSVSEGTIQTNGTQPLATFLYAGCFFLANGDKSVGLIFALLLQILSGIVTAYVLYRLVRILLADNSRRKTVAFLTAALWFSSPKILFSTMNCLETCIYMLFVIVTIFAFIKSSTNPSQSWPIQRSILIGILSGFTFLARNDAIFLIFAMLVVFMFQNPIKSNLSFVKKILHIAITGLTTAMIAMPWMIYNQSRFGNIIPISGQAESRSAPFAGNLKRVPTALAENMSLLPIPASIEDKKGAIIISGLFALFCTILILHFWRTGNETIRLFLGIGGIYGILLITFYGLFFGAGHFIHRFLAPVSLFAALGLAASIHRLIEMTERMTPLIKKFIGVSMIIIIAGINISGYCLGNKHSHFHIAEWANRNIPKDTWIGALQSGTLGYFHDRTINLDGKVNPEALNAIRQNRRPQYILEKRIVFIADWAQTFHLMNDALLNSNFDLIVNDKKQNLMVMKRRELPEKNK